MSDWIGLAFLVLLVFGAWLGLRALNKPQKLTADEFEKRAAEGKTMLGAGMMELQKIIDPQANKAAAVVQDFKGGKYKKRQDSGDDNDDGEIDEQQIKSN